MTPPPRPPLDPGVARAFGELDDVIVSITTDDIPRLRRGAVAASALELTRHGAFVRSTRTIIADDLEVPVVIALPVDARRPVPVLLHLHGGGLVSGDADSEMPAVAALAERVGCAVVSVAYRLAPEHPYPAALDDVVAALRWLGSADAPAEIDPARIVVTGISAGAGLAAALALYVRDHGGPRPAGLLLQAPMLDHRSTSHSAVQMAGHGSWDRAANEVAWAAYLGGGSGGPDDATVPVYASAALADDLSGLPPTFIDVGSAETFRDECLAFADAIWRAGGDAELHVWPGGTHAFDLMAPWLPLSRDAQHARRAWLRRILRRA
ncbi:alpha/beta hydrolase [Microbacterium sp. VKM Ac-2870]|uniref:alpha/beta hydrolase n=1 Tax=Microbacterium sp. VKM Ac-2870 TaxID=2783825 RepID=UPI00188C5B84|nr:alpha/beta hydrolase [Microbacterium sp. VKM Ac-2870]MBF4562484.1 alpha/beta hydrolase [Microbacterium sp. VKM Ac-2870]